MTADLEVLRSFVNTLDVASGSDDLGSPDDLHAWLTARSLLEPTAGVTHDDHTRALALREALRALMTANGEGEAPEEEAIAALNAVAARSPLTIVVSDGGASELVPEARGVDAALARLLIIVHRAMETGEWPRLKACRNEACRWAFYDHSKNRSGQWCSMAACGSQHKARAYRQRRKVSGSAGTLD